MMPGGIPGMGKSTFIGTRLRPYFEALQDVHFTTFSSDKIRKDLVDAEIVKNKASHSENREKGCSNFLLIVGAEDL